MQAGHGQDMGDAVFLIQGKKFIIQIGLVAQQ